MAMCKVCGKDMLRSDGCRAPKIHIGGKIYKRIKVGDPGDFVDGGPDTRCPDCNALFGHLHHWGCDAERCPACGHQLITCSCEDVFIQG